MFIITNNEIINVNQVVSIDKVFENKEKISCIRFFYAGGNLVDQIIIKGETTDCVRAEAEKIFDKIRTAMISGYETLLLPYSTNCL